MTDKAQCKVCERLALLGSNGMCCDCTCLEALDNQCKTEEGFEKVDRLEIGFYMGNLEHRGGNMTRVLNRFVHLGGGPTPPFPAEE